MAFSYSFESAILSSIFEIIERDSIMIMWHNKLSLPKISLEKSSLPTKAFEFFQKKFRYFDLSRVHCINVTSDIGIPTIFTVITGDGSDTEPAMAVGAACRLDPVECLFKSVMEAMQTYAWARYLKKEKTIEKDELGQFRVSGFDKHVQRYTKEENLDDAKLDRKSVV